MVGGGQSTLLTLAAETQLTAGQRNRVLANGRYLEVHWGTCQQAVVDFMFAALSGTGLEPANDSS